MLIDFEKGGGLVPVIVQDYLSNQVLMLAYMNKEAFQKTIETKRVCFYSRSRKCLWTKGESSGNYLALKSYQVDCDNDTLLMMVDPYGPVCHRGTVSCFADETVSKGFIYKLERTIDQRSMEMASESYTASLLNRGINKVAQKLGEEAVELIIEAKDDNKALFVAESADLIYHFMVLLKAKGIDFNEIEEELLNRFEEKN